MFNAIEKITAKITNEKIKHKLAKILSTFVPTNLHRSECDFDLLQNRFPLLSVYEYDAYSLWERAQKRISVLFDTIPAIKKRGLRIVDAGAGDGILCAQLSLFGHQAICVDREDWRDEQARHLPFIQNELENIDQVESDSVDVVISFNTFEHVQDPEMVLNELLRILKPKGLFYTHFGPLYHSPWGLHCYRTLHMPYAQFLFSSEFIEEKLQKYGVKDLGKDSTSLQPLNKWSLNKFEVLFHSSGHELLKFEKQTYFQDLELILEYPEAFQGRGLSVEDVTTRSLEVLIRKQS
ncbi:MAG: class I SAM-dependent methyltransferase [Sumerlaeia bacterium]